MVRAVPIAPCTIVSRQSIRGAKVALRACFAGARAAKSSGPVYHPPEAAALAATASSGAKECAGVGGLYVWAPSMAESIQRGTSTATWAPQPPQVVPSSIVEALRWWCRWAGRWSPAPAQDEWL